MTRVHRMLSTSTWLALGLTGAVATFRWSFALWNYRDSGVDPTDEGYYLAAVEFPSGVPHGPTDFAHYLKLLWWLSGRDLSNFRVTGLLVLLTVAGALGWATSTLFDDSRRFQKYLVGISAASAIAGLLLYQYILWIPTPNYNYLNVVLTGLFTAVLIVQIGQLRKEKMQQGRRQRTLTSIAAAFLLVALLATRTTVGLAAVVVYGSLLTAFRGSSPLRTRARPLVLGLILAAATHVLLTRSMPWTTVARWRHALDLSVLRDDHPASRLWEPQFFTDEVLPWLIVPVSAVLAIFVIRRIVGDLQIRLLIGALASPAVIIAMWSDRPDGGLLAAQTGVGLWWMQLAILALTVSLLAPTQWAPEFLVGPAILFLAFVGAMGSANGVFRQFIFTSGLAFAGLVVHAVILQKSSKSPLPSALPTAFLLIFALYTGQSGIASSLDMPYRMGPYRPNEATLQKIVDPITANTEDIVYGNFGDMQVHPASVDFISWVASVKEALPPSIKCVVNLEGGTPVISALLGVQPAGTLWDIGSYPGSDEGAAESLRRDKCWQVGTFVLIDSPDGDRAITVPPSISALCGPPFTEFRMDLSHRATVRASLCEAR